MYYRNKKKTHLGIKIEIKIKTSKTNSGISHRSGTGRYVGLRLGPPWLIGFWGAAVAPTW